MHSARYEHILMITLENKLTFFSSKSSFSPVSFQNFCIVFETKYSKVDQAIFVEDSL